MIKTILTVLTYVATFILGFSLAAWAASINIVKLRDEVSHWRGLYETLAGSNEKPKPRIVGLSGHAKGKGGMTHGGSKPGH